MPSKSARCTSSTGTPSAAAISAADGARPRLARSGRAAPSRELLLRLAEPLALPLRERNRLLLAAGFAPLHKERSIDDADMAAAKEVVEAVLR